MEKAKLSCYTPHRRSTAVVAPSIIIWQGKSERSDWFFLGRDYAIRNVSFCYRKTENSKQAWPECHVINYSLTEQARAVLGNISLRSFLYPCARSVLPRPGVNIPQCGPHARLVLRLFISGSLGIAMAILT